MLKRSIGSVAALFGAMALFVGTVIGATITVDDDGPADYSSIKEAVEAASEGDTVLVRAGTYIEDDTIEMKNGLVLQGAGADSTVILGNYSWGAVIAFYEVENARIDGFTIASGPDDWPVVGISIYNCSPAVTRNRMWDPSYWNPSDSRYFGRDDRGLLPWNDATPQQDTGEYNRGWAAGLQVLSLAHEYLDLNAQDRENLEHIIFALANKQADRYSQYGTGRLYWAWVYEGYTRQELIMNFAQYLHSTVSGTIYPGMVWEGTIRITGDLTVPSGVTLTISPGTTVIFSANSDDQHSGLYPDKCELAVYGTLNADGVVFRSSNTTDPSNSDWEGITVKSGGTATITNSTIRDAVWGVWNEGDLVLGEGSEVTNCGGGVTTFAPEANTASVTISETEVHGITGTGTYFYSDWIGVNVTASVKNSLLHHIDSTAVAVHTGSQATLENNTIAYNAGGATAEAAQAHLVLRNNIISGNSGAGVRRWDPATVELYYNDLWQNQAGNYLGCSPGTGDISEDPLFVDGVNDNYHLQGGSPCIDAGDPASDYSAEPQPNGGRINMGRYGGTAQAAVDTQAPDISSVSASNITATSATINWTTNESSDSKVDYGTTTSYGSTKSNSGMVTSHSIDLSGLSGHTTYHYRVRSTDAAGNEAASGDYTFTTLNRTPTADAQSVSTNEDTPLSITLSGSDPDGDPLTYIVVTNPSHGSLSGSGQTRTYTPSANYYGSDSFTFKVNDGIVDSDPDTVSITVNSVNDAPWIYPTIPDQSANEDYPIVIDLTGYEHDVEDSGTNLDWTVSGENPNLIASTSGENSSDDAITFTPIADSSGSDVVTLTLRDSGGRTASQEVTLTWNAVNDPPTLAEIPDQSTPEATEWSYNCSVWDPDGPSLSWSLANAPPGMSINSSGKISWSVPDLTSTTTYYNITVTVQDNGNPNESDSDPLNLTINADNDAPVIDGYSPSSSSPTSQCVYQLRGRVHQLHRCEPEHICRHRRRPDEDKQQFNRRYMGKLHFFQILDPLFRRWEQDSLRMGGVESG